MGGQITVMVIPERLRGTFVSQRSFEKLNRSETATNIYTGLFFDLLVNFFLVL